MPNKRNKRKKVRNATKQQKPINIIKPEPQTPANAECPDTSCGINTIEAKVPCEKPENTRLKQIEIEEISISTSSSSNSCEAVNYRVESPQLIRKDSSKLQTSTKETNFSLVKSKSLDDLDNPIDLKITELKSGDEQSDDEIKVRACNEAVISEADSDIDWEVTEDLEVDETLKNGSKLSSQEEEQLRYFIDKLNLPEASGSRTEVEQEQLKVARSSSAIRQKRHDRRKLMQYFAPLYDNPCFLEAISEESLDLSEKDKNRLGKNSFSNENVVNVVSDVIQRGKAEVVLIESSSGDDEEDESDDFEMQETGEEYTPPPTPEIIVSLVEDVRKELVLEEQDENDADIDAISNSPGELAEKPKSPKETTPSRGRSEEVPVISDTVSLKDNQSKERQNENDVGIDVSSKTHVEPVVESKSPTEPLREQNEEIPINPDSGSSKENQSKEDFIQEILKDIEIKEEIIESTKNIQTFEISVKKIHNQSSATKESESTPEESDLKTEIASVEQRIRQTERSIAHDQELIDKLQDSLEQDQKEIQEAQQEIEHMKSFEKEFKEVLTQKKVFSRSSKERSTSRSSDSSNSSIGTTVLLNPSLKDMAAIAAEAEQAEKARQEVSSLDKGNPPPCTNSDTVITDRLFEPSSLKDTCLHRLIELPFGQDALEELASVSTSLKEFTDSLPKVAYKLINNSGITVVEKSKTTSESITKTVTENNRKQEDYEDKMMQDVDGVTVISRTTKEECKKHVDESETIKEEVIVENVVDISGSKKLLDIVLQEKLNHPEEVTHTQTVDLEELQRLHEARLNAKDKSEWLELVRNGLHPQVPKRKAVTENQVSEAVAPKLTTAAPPERPQRRRRSLPPELHVRQMQYLIEKEKHIQAQLDSLEAEKRQLLSQMTEASCAPHRPTSLPPHEELRQRMYEEYRRQLAEREQRRAQKVIKISLNENEEVTLPIKATTDFNDVQREFITTVNEKRKQNGKNVDSRESSAEKSDGGTVLVLDGVELRKKKVPKHLKEFVNNAEQSEEKQQNGRRSFPYSEDGNLTETEEIDLVRDGIWSPGQKSSFDRAELQRESTQVTSQESLRSNEEAATAPPVWTPKSAGSSPVAERKEFRPVNFESPVLPRKNRTKSDGSANAEPPWNRNVNTTSNEAKLPTSQSAPGPGFSADFAPRLPKAQNPTITLLQKAREGQIPPKSAAYIEQERGRRKNESPYGSQNDLIYNLRTESISDSDSERPRRINHQVRQPYEGIGPTTTHGMPVGLRSEIRDANMSQWYKRMYDTIHKHRPSKYDDEEYVTIRYKQRNRARHPFATGYVSEPEAGAYDSEVALTDDHQTTLDRRRVHPHSGSSSNVAYPPPEIAPNSVYNRYVSYSTSTLPSNASKQGNTFTKTASHFDRSQEETIRYKPEPLQSQSALSLNRPGKIEHYTPGKSSISESEAKKWWDEVMDIFDGWLEDHAASRKLSRAYANPELRAHIARHAMEKQQQRPKVPLVQPKGYLSQALKESGYESDSTLVFRRRDETAQQLSPLEQREVYKNIQKGGDVPLHGLRKSMPERPKEEHYYPTLTRLRENRGRSRSSSKEKDKEIICHPVLTTFENDTFAAYKRSAPSSLYKIPPKAIGEQMEVKRRNPVKPPSPPRRKSSRNNSTLRMIHHGGRSVSSNKSKSPIIGASGLKRHERHETCFSPIPKGPNTVRNLREKITTKLSPALSSSSSLKSLNTTKDEVKRPRTVSRVVKCYCTRNRSCSRCNAEREKLKSPVEVKKAVMSQINSMNGNSSSVILAKINGSRKVPKTKTTNTKKTFNSIGSLDTIGSSRSTLKSTSMDSLKSIAKLPKQKPKTISKLGGSKPESRKDPPKKLLKKTKSKKEFINTQMKSSSTDSHNVETKVTTMSKFPEKTGYVPKPFELLKNQSDGFFQQLFFGPSHAHKLIPEANPLGYFATKLSNESHRICDPTIGALKRYLSHTKPVSESRFKYLDMIRSRSSSLKSLQNHDSSHERSISLPPKLIFTQTSRPGTPIFERKKLSIYTPPESHIPEPKIEKLIFSETSRPVSPVVRRATTPSSIDGSLLSSRCPSPCETLYFTETSRPVSPVVLQRPPPLPRRPISPVYYPPESPRCIRSPSYRRIKQKRGRIQSTEMGSNQSQRFKDLNRFYQDLERVGQLERTASFSDLPPRRRFEDDIIDYDHWQEVRQRERAERELCSLYRSLKQTQEEHDFLFRPKPLGKWKRSLDRGLRIKERSVENLREEFEKIRKDQAEKERKLKEDLNVKRGVYKSLWRGNSVVNLAQTFSEPQRSQSESRALVRQRICDNEKLLTHGIGSRIWSSLSMEQVNILKNQLSEIYRGDNRFSGYNPKPVLSLPKQNTINVSIEKTKAPKELRVRRNSDTVPPKDQRIGHLAKSKSSATLSKSMSEDEKKKLSQSLSKEVLNIHRNRRNNVVKAKETLGAIAAANASETLSPRTCYSLEVSEDEQKKSEFLLVLAKSDAKVYKETINEILDIWSKPKPVEAEIKTDCVNIPVKHPKSETESTSTDGSTKTVIFNGDTMNKPKVKKDVIQSKVTYFENKDKEEYTPTIYKPSDEPADDYGDTLNFKPRFGRSQSNQDLRELFGESQLNRIANEPLYASRKSKYSKPRSPVLRSSFHRARSLSPESQYPKCSLKVNDLKTKFEEFYNQRFALPPRRCASDPQLGKLFHEGEKVTELRSKFEYPKGSGRGRSRVRKSGLISSSYLKAEDRYMPHINIISKIATLYPKSHRKETTRSTENLASILGIPVGEVHKLRERFDAADKEMSILGHMFTSSPNINELRDVAQYLTGNWYAHKHPKAEDGDVVPKTLIRPKSASPPRLKNKLASILKLPRGRSTLTAVKKKEGNQSRDIARKLAPFRSSWSPSSKHSVHFKEPEGPPPPPPSVEHMQSSEISEERSVESQEIKTNMDLNSESPRKYVENEVTIHYRTPVRQEVKEAVDEHELAQRQADAMRKIYEEERQRKHLQVSSYSENELQDRRSRRHTDNFTPSQKSPIPLNRYDDFIQEMSSRMKIRPRSPEPRLVARALFNFVGQSARELTFKKGDVIYVRRQIDKNWYEGELNAMIGLFPSNYVEIVPYDGVKTTTRKANEGQARAKYNFIAQSHLELSLAKGELVVVTRRVDDNWYEGKIGGRKGIFPVSYVEMLVDPQEATVSTKPVASPAAHSLLLNGSSGGKESMGTHNYVPTFPTQDLGMSYRAKPVQITDAGTYGSLKKNPIDQALHIDIQNDPVPYRSLYKYRPQNEDELELLEGDIVQVLEKCDDGWFVGTSERTGAFGTFPGNYVEKVTN